MDSVSYNLSQDARGNYSMTSAMRVGGTRKPRTYQRFSPVKITRADGSVAIIAKPARNYRGRTTKPRIIEVPRHITAADLPALFAD